MDHNWEEMKNWGMLKKLKDSVLKKIIFNLDMFLKRHNLLHRKMKKAEKAQINDAWLSMQLLNATTSAIGEREKNENVDVGLRTEMKILIVLILLSM